MTLASLLSADRIVPEMKSTEHFAAIVELVDHLVFESSLPTESREVVLAALRAREDDRSTGIGNGVAIPHCFSENIQEVALIFGKSEKGIDFCSLDRAPVHYIILFVVPKSQYTLHLKTLAAIAKILGSAETRDLLDIAEDSSEILDILTLKSTEV